MRKTIRNDAIRFVSQQFSQNGVKLMGISDVYSKDEQGRVSFVNPENGAEFRDRVEAQQWIDVMNKQIQQEFNNQVGLAERQYMQAAEPAMRLLQFAPVYDQMKPKTQEVFDQLIEPYGITNNQGQVIGFSCDLGKMASQAIQLTRKFGGDAPQQNVQQARQQATQPAMDMKTGGGQPANDKEPTTLEEAWRMMNANKKGN